MDHALIPVESIARTILIIREQKVILDSDLAQLYGTTTVRLNQAVKRNAKRFPDDFLFQLTSDEKQEVITKCDRFANMKFSPSNPYAFTEHGAVMVASILKTDLAADVSVYVVRAFIRMREILSSQLEVSQKLRELETRLDSTDEAVATLIDAIHQLLAHPEGSDRRIGFRRTAEE
ncbi:MAG: ORF6N domain-containing protein [Armatimonadota bacterium]